MTINAGFGKTNVHQIICRSFLLWKYNCKIFSRANLIVTFMNLKDFFMIGKLLAMKNLKFTWLFVKFFVIANRFIKCFERFLKLTMRGQSRAFLHPFSGLVLVLFNFYLVCEFNFSDKFRILIGCLTNRTFASGNDMRT